MRDNKQIPSNWKDWRKFLFENWETISEAYEKALQKYCDATNLFHADCIRCLKYNNETCGGWTWTEDPNTHKCINFVKDMT